METRRIGSLDVSIVGLGCNNFGWRLDFDRTAAVVDAALEAGINFLDTADIYGGTTSEEFLGRALEGRRDGVVIATKFGMKVDEQRQGAKPDYARRACEDSLRRLRTDHIDLYQLHQPDPSTPVADTLAALDELVRSGKVREIGCSNFSAQQLREARTAAGQGAKFVSVQNEFSLLHREPEREVLAECERQGLAFLPFFPLAGGMLTGKYRQGQPAPENGRLSKGSRFLNDRNLGIAEKLLDFAASRHHSLLELAFSWLLSHPPVASVIAGATSPEQVRANVAAAGWRLSPADLAEIDRLAPAA
ncbi:MAG TPA: aldo/keto reductase [Thermoanaerobaculia bacterium]|jgi:aryl-alcohol dehydrogenase-like predicted oxidoreductase|nr:aldo/keto reductase [Thermoanaerobaculia bacterium]